MKHQESSLDGVSITELRQAAAFISKLQEMAEAYPKFRAGNGGRSTKDRQRELVYAAEGLHSLWKRERFVCLAELKEFVCQVERSPWYRRNFGKRKIEVSPGAVDQVGAMGGLFFISVPPVYRRKLVVLHEIAHAVYWRPSSQAQDHGPMFCAVYIFLVKQFLGEAAADEMSELFARKGVRFASESSVHHIRAPKLAMVCEGILEEAFESALE